MAETYRPGQTPAAKRADSGLEKESRRDYPLGKNNFLWMITAGAMIVIGFLLMLGSGSTEEFNPDIFSVRRIVIGPTIAFLGFVAMGIAIIIKPKSKASSEDGSKG